MAYVISALSNNWGNMPTPEFCLIDNSSLIDAYAKPSSLLTAKHQQQTLDAIEEMVRLDTVFVLTSHNKKELASAIQKAVLMDLASSMGENKRNWRNLTNTNPAFSNESVVSIMREEYDHFIRAIDQAPGIIFMEPSFNEGDADWFAHHLFSSGMMMQDNEYVLIAKSFGLRAIFTSDAGYLKTDLDLYTVSPALLNSSTSFSSSAPPP